MITAKQVEALYAAKKEISNAIEDNKINQATDWDLHFQLTEEFKKLEAKIEAIPTVTIQYWIGSRKYYDNAIKVGQRFFLRGRSMTKARGYHGIEQIEEITEKMSSEMLADFYYY